MSFEWELILDGLNGSVAFSQWASRHVDQGCGEAGLRSRRWGKRGMIGSAGGNGSWWHWVLHLGWCNDLVICRRKCRVFLMHENDDQEAWDDKRDPCAWCHYLYIHTHTQTYKQTWENDRRGKNTGGMARIMTIDGHTMVVLYIFAWHECNLVTSKVKHGLFSQCTCTLVTSNMSKSNCQEFFKNHSFYLFNICFT